MKANRYRFILPIEKDINFFTDIINNCIELTDKTVSDVVNC